MPVYRSTRMPNLYRYGMTFYRDEDLSTNVIVPSDPDISVVDPNPIWDPVLASDHLSISTGSYTDITVPYFTILTMFRVRVISGEVKIYLNDPSHTPLILVEGDTLVLEWPKHYVDLVRFEAVANAELVYNIFKWKPRDKQNWT